MVSIMRLATRARDAPPEAVHELEASHLMGRGIVRVPGRGAVARPGARARTSGSFVAAICGRFRWVANLEAVTESSAYRQRSVLAPMIRKAIDRAQGEGNMT